LKTETTLTETRKKDRKIMIAEVTRLCDKHGVGYTVLQEYPAGPRCDAVSIVDARTALALTLDFDGGSVQPNTFVLAWHFDWKRQKVVGDKFQVVPGFAQGYNEYHFRKATDVCRGFEDLMYTLDRRLCSIAKGEATDPSPIVVPTGGRQGFMVFCDTICDGDVPLGVESVEGEPDKWVVFDTEREAQLDLIDDLEEAIRQFKEGEREYEEIVNDNFILAVEVHADGSISTDTATYPAPCP